MESIKDAITIAIEEETHVAAARRAAADLCRRMSLLDETIARSELVAVELAANILHHATRGKLYLAPAVGSAGLLILAVDSGPGVANLDRAMEDGFSTGTTPGLGLGAVRRKADQVDVYSLRDHGTVVSAVIANPGTVGLQDVAVLSTPIEGEIENGDNWAMYRLPGRTIYLMIDGLGHGRFASEAAKAANRVVDAALDREPEISLPQIMQRMHQPMQATRGAAVLLVSCSPSLEGQETKVLCCGIGNISGVLCAPDGGTRALVSHNGTVGHRMVRVQEFAYPAVASSLLVLHSDGISNRWKLAQYPGLQQHGAASVAGILYRDATRGRDDASILVARLGAVAHA